MRGGENICICDAIFGAWWLSWLEVICLGRQRLASNCGKFPVFLKIPTNHKTELEKRNLAIDVPIKYTHITVNSGLDAEVCRHNVRSHLTF